ncbi:MAG TPA: MoxR family ATPase [Actinomycetota bacterium]|nr:MoxR family ATPase [Actinomycetota bacterium]
MSGAPLEDTRAAACAVLDEVGKVIVGKRDVLELVLLGILARGHVLLEDFPGLAKTLMARCFAQAIGIRFSRIQFTPDLLPADITGSLIFDQSRGAFEFRPGPVFTNLLLGDEINRAPPKTQAALLEAMQEGQVTVEDTTHGLDPPFVVIATQNPIEYEGTYPLPEAQLDRFMLRVSIGYPDREQEWGILRRRLERGSDDIRLRAVIDGPQLLAMQRSLEDVYVGDASGHYIVDLVKATRDDPDVAVGASPRGALAVLQLARARALLGGRDFVTPDDVKAVAAPALGHRLTLRPELWVKRVSGQEVVARVLERVPTPPTRAGRPA